MQSALLERRSDAVIPAVQRHHEQLQSPAAFVVSQKWEQEPYMIPSARQSFPAGDKDVTVVKGDEKDVTIVKVDDKVVAVV